MAAAREWNKTSALLAASSFGIRFLTLQTQMLQSPSKNDTESRSITLDVSAVCCFLPHRDVMALLDGIGGYWPEERRIWAQKHIPMNEFSIQGFLPENPCFPPTLVVEALAQTCGIMMNMEGLVRAGGDVWRFPDATYRETLPAVELSVLAESAVKHHSYALPGETLKLNATVSLQRKEMHYFKVAAEVEGREIASGSILLSYPTYM